MLEVPSYAGKEKSPSESLFSPGRASWQPEYPTWQVEWQIPKWGVVYHVIRVTQYRPIKTAAGMLGRSHGMCSRIYVGKERIIYDGDWLK